MTGRLRRNATTRIDPASGEVLPEGIRYRTDRGRYEVRVRVRYPDGIWHERSRTFLTLAEANSGREALLRALAYGGEIPLERWHERYWPVVEASVRPATARAYDAAWRMRVSPALGHLALAWITSPAIEAAMLEWPGALSTKKEALSILSRLLDGARRARLIDRNPVKEVRVPREAQQSSLRSRALSVDEIRHLLALISAGPYRSFAAGLAFTGMRAGEASALRVGDVDFDAGVIHVCRSLSPGRSGELIEQAPKGYRNRYVPLCEEVRPYLYEAAQGKQAEDHLFTGVRNRPLTNRALVGAVDWARIRE